MYQAKEGDIMSTAIICAVLIVIAIIGIKSYAKKLTSGCCGASSQPSVKKNESQG